MNFVPLLSPFKNYYTEMMKILFLGYSKKKTCLIDFIKSHKNLSVTNHNKKITLRTVKKFNLVICYGYRYIIHSKVIEQSKIPIINLHIGYLPYNRGAHPNFWSFAENTPAGVTIHQVDKNIDAGKIIFQKIIDFEILENRDNLTFSNTYSILKKEIESLFMTRFKQIIRNDYEIFDQIGKGSFHLKSELPGVLKSWNQNIFKTIIKYNHQMEILRKKNMDIIDRIEDTRSSNNINWMNIIRTSLNFSSKETLQILKKIKDDDNKISLLFKKLTDDK